MPDYEFDIDRFEKTMKERRDRRLNEKREKQRCKQMRNRRIMSIVMSLVLLVTVSAFIDAYMSDSERAYNEISIGGSNIDIVEEFDPPKELTPGISFTKNVSVKNQGPNFCYIRVMAVFTNSDMGQYCTVDWNDTDWVYNANDEYWYYTKSVPEGWSTSSLFTTVTLSEDIPEAMIQSFDMIVYAESYQATGFANYEDAWAAYHANKPANDEVAEEH